MMKYQASGWNEVKDATIICVEYFAPLCIGMLLVGIMSGILRRFEISHFRRNG